MFGGSQYSISRTSTALSTTNDWATILAHATRPTFILEILFGGQGTASAANEILIQRSTGGTTGGGSITPAEMNPLGPAYGGLVHTTWAAQPTLTAADVLLRIPLNANGAIFRWTWQANGPLLIPAATQVSIRSASGTSSVTGTLLIEEL